ncbi:MAG: hypothetical protein H7330_09065 [Hymenobacteraceae bacterium]|nr:hypothetical protein [Hymenobacteraceae bacterium]
MEDASLLPDLPTTPEARAEYIKAAQQARSFKALSALFQAELQASPTFQRAMKPYFAGGHVHFAAFYANAKTVAYLKGPLALQRQEERFLEYREAAAEHLWEIQQKKLFDLQCQWRAEQVTLPGIRHAHEFEQWGTYLKECPWLPPITAEEVAVYEAYLRSGRYEPERNWAWQGYDNYRRAAGLSSDEEDADEEEADEEEAAAESARRALPAWYVFHNAYTGAGALLALPDIRGAKEQRYLDLTNADKEEKLAAQCAAGNFADSLPWPPFSLNIHNIGPYFDQFEPTADLPRLHRWRTAASAYDAHKWGVVSDATHWMDRALKEAAEPWPIAANADWRVAVAETGIRYWAHQLAEVIGGVWREQEQNRALGLPVTPPKQYGARPPFAEIDWAEEESYYPKFILRGRELAGELRDFNF